MASRPRPRDTLVDAVLPTAHAGLPPVDPAARADFWARFDRDAPWTLRTGFGLAVLLLTGVMPWVVGPRRPWRRLSDAERDTVLRRCDARPWLADLLEVARLVTCMLVFDDDRAVVAVRDRAP